MDSEKRKGAKPIPDNFEELINEAQRSTLRDLEPFGWRLHFVRRPLFQEVVPVLVNKEGDRFVILEANGKITEDRELDVRTCTPAPELQKKIAR
jgi:hypothetical protein